MKTIFTTCIVLLFSIPGFSQWEPLDVGVDVDSFYDVQCVSSSNIIAVGSGGTILRSLDGGDNWEQKDSGTEEILWNVEFPTPEVGYVTGGGGILLKTIDGGENWDLIETGLTGGFYGYGLSCLDENTLFINANGGLIKSDDGGESWTSFVDVPISREIQFINNDVGFAGSFLWENWNTEFYKTIDGGNTWQTLTGVAPFHFLSEDVGFYYLGGLRKTADGGDNFENLTFVENEEFTFSDIFVVHENTIWGLIYLSLLDGDTSSRGFMKISSDDSGVFTEVRLSDNNPELNFVSMDFENETLGFAVGSYYDEGIIWRNGNGTNEMMGADDATAFEFQVYPNPSHGEINISLGKLMTESFEVIISDMAGNKVHSESFSDVQNFKLNTKGLSKGVYILRIKTELKSYTQKIIIN